MDREPEVTPRAALRCAYESMDMGLKLRDVSTWIHSMQTDVDSCQHVAEGCHLRALSPIPYYIISRMVVIAHAFPATQGMSAIWGCQP